MDIYVKVILFPYFLFFFWFSNMILSYTLILPVLQLQSHNKWWRTGRRMEDLAVLGGKYQTPPKRQKDRHVFCLSVCLSLGWSLTLTQPTGQFAKKQTRGQSYRRLVMQLTD